MREREGEGECYLVMYEYFGAGLVPHVSISERKPVLNSWICLASSSSSSS